MANRILFDAADPITTQPKLYVSDGTSAGTRALNAVGGSYYTSVNNAVVYVGYTYATGSELYRTDGTTAGTGLLVNINPTQTNGQGASGFVGFSNNYLPGSSQLAPQFLPIGTSLLFLGNDGTHGTEFWKTDGTAAGTSMVKDLYPGSTGSSQITDVVPFGNGYLFAGADDTHGLELFKTDGTAAGTVLVKDIEPQGITSGGTFNPYTSQPDNITPLGDGTRAIFAATVLTSNGADRELWITDGTATGTTLVKQINADTGGAQPNNITQLGHTGRAVFTAKDKPNNTPKGAELFVTDGTAAGTKLVADLDPGQSATLSGFKQFGDKILFTYQEDGFYAPAIWVTDGTAVGTIKLLSSAPAGAFGFVDFGGKELFWTNKASGYSTPWITDGTVAGTIQLSTTAVLGDSYGWAVLGSIALFSGDTGNFNGTELWQTDGTVAGTRVAQDIYPQINKSSYPQGFAVLNGKAVFQADGGSGPQPYVYDYFASQLAATGGTNVTNITAVTLPCFCAGTRIGTPSGECAVEQLAVGDLVLTHRYKGVATRRVIWLGHREVDCTTHPQPQLVWPIRVCKDAFGHGQPWRDLFLSPEHAIFHDGVLFPVQELVDGHNVQRMPRNRVTYWHVELEEHDVLLADGLPAESYLENGNRTDFDEATVVSLHPQFQGSPNSPQACAPVQRQGEAIQAVRALLACNRVAPGPLATPRKALEAAGN